LAVSGDSEEDRPQVQRRGAVASPPSSSPD
jgi:hypothetical protein